MYLEHKHRKGFLLESKYHMEAILLVLGQRDASFLHEVLSYVSFFVEVGRVQGGMKSLRASMSIGRSHEVARKLVAVAGDDNNNADD